MNNVSWYLVEKGKIKILLKHIVIKSILEYYFNTNDVTIPLIGFSAVSFNTSCAGVPIYFNTSQYSIVFAILAHT